MARPHLVDDGLPVALDLRHVALGDMPFAGDLYLVIERVRVVLVAVRHEQYV